MKILYLALLLIAFILFCRITVILNDKYWEIRNCSVKVKAKHEGFKRKEYSKSKGAYYMVVSYDYDDRAYKTCLLDDYPLRFFAKRASKGDQEVYIDPKHPGRAVLFRKRILFGLNVKRIVTWILVFASLGGFTYILFYM
ncbi:MAG: hypothetical protein MJ246_05305 [Clostridia bacterium]|nr:hypothetical protein [Clostridia bacterium]